MRNAIALSMVVLFAVPAYGQETAPSSQPAATAPITIAPTFPNEAPQDIPAAIQMAKDAFQAGKARNWWMMSALIIWLVMFGFKLGGLLEKFGRRWGYIIVAVLSMAAMLFAKFGGGISWEGAIMVLTSGPFMAYGNDLIKRGILGKEPENDLKK